MTKHHTKSLFCYTILGHTLMLVEQHMYLGVKLDHRLSWPPHIDYVRNKANKVIRIPEKKSSKLSKIFSRVKLQAIYYTIVRILCTNMGPIPPSMLADLHWPLLSQRRKCARLTLLHKSLNNLLSIPSTYLPVPTPLLSTRSNHNQKFLHYHTSVDCYKFSFSPRTVPEWNDLPTRIVQCKSLDIFNQYLREYIIV